MNDQVEKHTHLFYTDSASDKAYVLHLVKDESTGLWLCTFQNGKRGKALSAGGRKTPEPVPYEVALKTFDSEVKRQTKRGYTEDESGTPFQGNANARESLGIQVQFLKPISVEALGDRLLDPSYIWQEKMDGERRPIRKLADGTIEGGNRQGLSTPLPLILVDAVRALDLDHCVIDGEDMGDGRYAAFDLLSCPQDPNGDRPYEVRFKHLTQLMRAAPSPCWVKIPTANTPEEAAALLDTIGKRSGEGIVGKRRGAPYLAGRNDDQIKYKFFDEATVIVLKPSETKRSVSMGVIDENGAVIEVGNVTIPPNAVIPKAGDILEVKYLYAYRGGDLYQPVFNKQRNDVAREECVMSQLKYKPDDHLEFMSDEPELSAPGM